MTEQQRPTPAPGQPGEPLPEGEETAPPGVRSMSIVRWSLVALMAVAAVGGWAYYADLAPRASRSAVTFMCPMHPSVIQDRPGECPICGMDLVKVEPGQKKPGAGAATAGAATGPGKYWCPMHPEITSDDPEARCDKCGGMKLVPREGKGSVAHNASVAGAGKYWCPMHPEVTSDDPEARCDKCGGMKLLPRDAPQPADASGVPGLVPVDISADRIQLMGTRTAKVARAKLAPQLRTVGYVSANEATLAILTARVTGWVEELKVAQSGQRVEKGDVLATVYSPELTTAQQVYVNATKWARDPRGAAPTGAVVGTIDQDARRRLELYGVAKQDIEELVKMGKPYEATPLRSPVSGYIARRGALPGLYFTPGTELFQIADLSGVWVIADIYEYDMSRVKVGQKARLVLGAYPGEKFTGRVQFIYPAVNPESRTLQARMEFRNPGLRLRPGMYGDVIIDLDAADGLAVPTEAIVDTGEHQYVFVAKAGGRFEPRLVQLGTRTEGRTQVLRGLAEGETVVTTANFLVDSESRLRAAVEGFSAKAQQDAEEREEREEKRERAQEHREKKRPPAAPKEAQADPHAGHQH
jgi:Cu(I)/Ag(I) efflux system membrane fusion protein